MQALKRGALATTIRVTKQLMDKDTNFHSNTHIHAKAGNLIQFVWIFMVISSTKNHGIIKEFSICSRIVNYRHIVGSRGVHCTKLVRVHVSAQEGY
jgi:hypothetical protein